MSAIRLNYPLQESDVRELSRVLDDISTRIDLLAAGFIAGKRNTATTIPTTGTYQKGDIVWNSNPVEAGTASSKYVIAAWECTTPGAAGTFVFKEVRFLTGN